MEGGGGGGYGGKQARAQIPAGREGWLKGCEGRGPEGAGSHEATPARARPAEQQRSNILGGGRQGHEGACVPSQPGHASVRATARQRLSMASPAPQCPPARLAAPTDLSCLPLAHLPGAAHAVCAQSWVLAGAGACSISCCARSSIAACRGGCAGCGGAQHTRGFTAGWLKPTDWACCWLAHALCSLLVHQDSEGGGQAAVQAGPCAARGSSAGCCSNARCGCGAAQGALRRQLSISCILLASRRRAHHFCRACAP